MAAALIHSADFVHADSFPNPQLLRPQNGVTGKKEVGSGNGGKVGGLKFRSWLFPDVHVMNLHWQVGRDVSIVEESRADTVNINFQMSGHMNTRFAGIAREVGMHPHQHNLIFSPEGHFRNTVRAGEQVEMFHISLRKKYFSDLIGCDDRWSEHVQESLLRDRPFAGVESNAGMTPYMQKLIGDIKQSGQSGPMQRLMLQSKVLELVALHLGQLQADTPRAPGLTVAETGRLNELKTFLDVHFLEDFSLPQLSRLCLLNEFKLKKGFRELFGTTVFAYLRKLRMDFAVNLLLDSSQSIDSISEMLGYEHSQHFSTAFKRHHGSPPSSFRS